jgi:hypothetical protein
MALHNDVAKNSLWPSTTVITPRFGGFATTQNKGKNHNPSPSYKRPRLNHFQQNMHGSHGNFGDNANKDVSSSMGMWGKLKDAKVGFKTRANPYISNFFKPASLSPRFYGLLPVDPLLFSSFFKRGKLSSRRE